MSLNTGCRFRVDKIGVTVGFEKYSKLKASKIVDGKIFGSIISNFKLEVYSGFLFLRFIDWHVTLIAHFLRKYLSFAWADELSFMRNLTRWCLTNFQSHKRHTTITTKIVYCAAWLAIKVEPFECWNDFKDVESDKKKRGVNFSHFSYFLILSIVLKTTHKWNFSCKISSNCWNYFSFFNVFHRKKKLFSRFNSVQFISCLSRIAYSILFLRFPNLLFFWELFPWSLGNEKMSMLYVCKICVRLMLNWYNKKNLSLFRSTQREISNVS